MDISPRQRGASVLTHALPAVGGAQPPPGSARPGVCPYHTSRDLLPEGAGLVLVTYQQLLNPTIRAANGLNLLLDKAIVVWDEAHNVPNAAREAATLLRPVIERVGRAKRKAHRKS
jgi:Rad3-related DNA helicase